MSIERGPSPQEMEVKQETVQESPIKPFELDSPVEDPWFQHSRVDRYNSQQMWEDLYANALKKWETDVITTPDIQQKLGELQESKRDEVKQAIEANVGIVLKNELLRRLGGVLSDKDLDYRRIEAIMVDEADQLGKEGLVAEVQITRRLVEEGVKARLGNETPQDMLNEERLIAYIANASPGFFEGEDKEERMQNLKHYASLFLKGYAATSYAFYQENPLVEAPMLGKTIDTMTDLTFDLHKHYQKPLKDWPWPSKNDWRLRNMEVQDKLDSVFGIWTNPAGHSYKFEQ